VGGRVDDAPTDETRRCASVWAGDESRPLLHTLTAMYAIESAQPAISATKRTGLRRHYGIPGGGLLLGARAARPRARGRSARADRTSVSTGESEDELVATTRRTLEANWSLLDGVERIAG